MTIRAALPLVLLGWLSVLAGVGLIPGAAPAALVLWPEPEVLAALPQDMRILSANGWSVTLAADPATLYALGARIVLPAGLSGCAPLET